MLPSVLLKWSWVFLGLLVLLTASAGGGIVLVSAILIRLPSTYFSEPRNDAHPVLRWTGLILKNVIGAALVVLGIIMAIPEVPGPGILIILLGIVMMDFAGKRRLERWLILRPKTLLTVNRLRQRYGKSPFVLEDPLG